MNAMRKLCATIFLGCLGLSLFAQPTFPVNGVADQRESLYAFKNATIVVAEQNFGCGSSREGAVYAFVDRGFQAVLAPSFGDIFFNNCLKNGLLPIQLSESIIAELFDNVEQSERGLVLEVDLERQEVSWEIDAKTKKKYPVYIHVYGGPGHNVVTNSFGGNEFFYQIGRAHV